MFKTVAPATHSKIDSLLACAKIQAAQLDGLIVTAYDGVQAVRTTSDRIAVDEAGEALIPCASFAALVDEFSGDVTVSHTADGNSTDVTSLLGKFSLPHPVGNYPALPAESAKPVAEFRCRTLALHRALRGVDYAVAPEGSSNIKTIEGVILEIDRAAGTVFAIGTDRLRLAATKIANAGTIVATGIEQISLSAQGVKNVASLAAGDDRECVLQLFPAHFVFRAPGVSYQATLIAGKFPAWRSFFPKPADVACSATVSVLALASAIRAADAVNTDLQRRPVTLDLTGTFLAVRLAGSERAETAVGVEEKTGPGSVANINGRHLLQHLAATKSAGHNLATLTLCVDKISVKSGDLVGIMPEIGVANEK